MRTKFLLLALSALALAAAAEERFGGTIMPYNLQACDGDPEKIAECLRTFKARGGISQFVLYGPTHKVRVSGMLDVKGYAALGEKVRQIGDLVSRDGIRVGYLMMPTVNCGINHPWRKFTMSSGRERAFTPCPREPGFRADFAAKCRAVAAAAHPFAYAMEDDFRYFGSGCYCPEHLRRIGEKVGRSFTRETLLEALGAETPEGAALRQTWHELQSEDLVALAKAASDAIAEVSPETRVMLCAPGGFPERETEAIARALAGRHRPAVRWWGAVYGVDLPVEAAGVLFFAQWSRENLPADIECLYESDPVPHSRFYASAARTGALISSVMAMGFDEPYHWGLGGAPDALATTPDYLDLHGREGMRYAAIGREARKGRSVGVRVHYDPASRPDDLFLGRASSFGAWSKVLGRWGVPVTTREAPVTLLSGQLAFSGLSPQAVTNLLSGAVVLDGAAAEALTRLGLSDLSGVEATSRDTVDFSGERTADGATSFGCSFHQNYGLDGCAVSRLKGIGAELVAVFYAGKPENVVQPSVTKFANRLGGRVAVMAVNLAGCKSPNVFSFAKRDLMVKLFRELGGEGTVPVRVLDRANATLLANEDPARTRLMLHLVNLSCDSADAVSFEVAAPYAGGKVERLVGDAWQSVPDAWLDGRLTVRADAPVYGTLVLRIARKEGRAPEAGARRGFEPFVPFRFGMGNVDEACADLREIRAKTGLRRFFLCGPGFNEVMYAPFPADLYARMGERMGEVKRRLADTDIELGWWCSPSIRYVSDFAPIEDAYGHKSVDNKKCPLDLAFQADWAAKVQSVVAAFRPSVVNIEDDYTLAWGRGLNGCACFCKRHLASFARHYGKPLTGSEIAAAFEKRTPENLPIRRAFADTIRDSLCELAGKVRVAVDEVDPSIRIMLCESGDNSDQDGNALEPIARAFAGPNCRPAVRPSGAIYGAQTTPADIPGAVAHAICTLERLPRDIETFYEADPYPHNRFFTSASQMVSLMSGCMFAGSQNILFYCLQYLDDPLEDTGYVDAYRAYKPRLDVVRDFIDRRDARLAGVRLVWHGDDLALTHRHGYGHGGLDSRAFVLSKMGLPYTTRRDAKGPALLAGAAAETMSDDEIRAMLSGGVLIDAPAAVQLTQRGFCDLLGTEVTDVEGRLPAIGERILPAAGCARKGKKVNAFYIFNAGTEGTVNRFATLKPLAGTESWSEFTGVGGKFLTPSLTVGTNALGGRVAVLATSLLGNRSSGLFNLRKQELVHNLFERLAPGVIPVSAVDAPGIWVLAQVAADGSDMLVMVNNLSGDVRDVTLAFAPDWTDCTISRLGEDGGEIPLGRTSARWTPRLAFGQMMPEFFRVKR